MGTLETSIQQMVAEFFEFLDHYAIHFAARIGKEMGCELLGWKKPRSSLWFEIESEPGSEWLFPPITRNVSGGLP